MMIGSGKVIEAAVVSEFILWHQILPELQARSSSSRELAWKTVRDYAPADEAASSGGARNVP